MDKYDLILKVIENPEAFSTSELEEIFRERGTREIYNILVKAESALNTGNKKDTNEEWERFNSRLKEKNGKKLHFSWINNRAASVAIIVVTSIAAIAAGIAVTVSLSTNSVDPVNTAANEVVANPKQLTSDNIRVENEITDSLRFIHDPILFENATLQAVMDSISRLYNVNIKFRNENSSRLHIYYKLTPSLQLEEILSQLNTFEQINIEQKNRTLIID